MAARQVPVGIDDIAFATAGNRLDLREMADHAGVDVDKYYVGIGQTRMSVPGEDEDVVTMGAEAAARVLGSSGKDRIRTLLFATESGVDQSKSAGVYVHRLVGLDRRCRVVELKQACYSGTAALQFALGLVARNPAERVLAVASDTARYDLDSPGEPTQGAAAVAFLVSADPRLLRIEPATGVDTSDVHDFWRPNHRTAALVDGKASLDAYLLSLEHAWADHAENGGAPFDAIDRFCYHQPFTKMAVKAHARLCELAGRQPTTSQRDAQIGAGLVLNRQVGNSYAASLWLGLVSLLTHDAADLTGRRVGMFSYGSGSVGEYFTGVVQPGYRSRLDGAGDADRLAARMPIGYARYRELHAAVDAHAGRDYATPRRTRGPFRFAGVSGQIRRYEPTGPAAGTDTVMPRSV